MGVWGAVASRAGVGGWSGDGGDAEQGVKYLGSWEKQGLWERSFNNGLQTCGLSNEVGGDIIY